MKKTINLLKERKAILTKEIANDIIKSVDKYKDNQPKWKVKSIEKKKQFLSKLNDAIKILNCV